MLFEYECKFCAHIGEDYIGINDPRPTTCPSCQAPEAISQIFTEAPKLSFTGKGWPSKEYKLDGQARKAMAQ